MATTVRSLFDKARALLNAYTEDGIQLPEEDYADLMTKSVPIADLAHCELFERARLDEEQEEPDTLTSIDSETQVNYKADQAISYYVAARLAPYKKKDLVVFFEDKYEQLKASCTNKAVAAEIEDVYSNGGDE